MAVLDRLRLNPGALCRTAAFRTGPAAGSFAGVQQGGRCQITCTKVNDGLYDLEAKSNAGTDYFFPWLQRSYTWVTVPKAVSNGTIVMTGGVNGCTLVVSEEGTNYHFYHDGDSKHLPQSAIRGNVVSRIAPSDYDPGDELNSIFSGFMLSYAKAGLDPKGDISYGLYVFYTKVSGQFIACKTGVISLGTPTGYKGGQIDTF